MIDYEKLDEAGLGSPDAKWDVVFITLGTTRKAAGSDEAFEKIDREYVFGLLIFQLYWLIFARYVINAARAARVEGHPQLLVYLSVCLKCVLRFPAVNVIIGHARKPILESPSHAVRSRQL